MNEPLRAFETHLLLAVGELKHAAYGLAIHDRLETLTGRSIALGQVYTGLARLERRGLVTGMEGESTPGRGGRPKKYYRLLPAALAELRASSETHQQLASLISRYRQRLEEY